MHLHRRGSTEFRSLPGRASADPFADRDVPVSVRLVRIEPGGIRRPHRHPHSCEVVHVLAGDGQAWTDGERHVVQAGDTFIIDAGIAHATLALPGRTLELLCVFPHPDLDANLEELEGPELTV